VKCPQKDVINHCHLGKEREFGGSLKVSVELTHGDTEPSRENFLGRCNDYARSPKGMI